MKERENKVLKRNRTKTTDGEFIYELENSYELSPVLSEQLLITAKRILLRENVLRQGQVEATVIGIEERAGQTIEKMYKKKVILTVDDGAEDIEIKKEFGRIGLRQLRIQRITSEAIEQEGVLSQEDISKHLSCDVRTVRRDIQEIKTRGIEIITRGVLHNIGRGQTHKKKIIELYLDGYLFSDIKQKTQHSIGAIKRYLQEFTKVITSITKGITDPEEIRKVTGISTNLIKQYKQVYEESRSHKYRKERIKNMTATRNVDVKKSSINTGFPAVLTTGGSR
jgi:hypothetical protein